MYIYVLHRVFDDSYYLFLANDPAAYDAKVPERCLEKDTYILHIIPAYVMSNCHKITIKNLQPYNHVGLSIIRDCKKQVQLRCY